MMSPFFKIDTIYQHLQFTADIEPLTGAYSFKKIKKEINRLFAA